MLFVGQLFFNTRVRYKPDTGNGYVQCKANVGIEKSKRNSSYIARN